MGKTNKGKQTRNNEETNTSIDNMNHAKKERKTKHTNNGNENNKEQ